MTIVRVTVPSRARNGENVRDRLAEVTIRAVVLIDRCHFRRRL